MRLAPDLHRFTTTLEVDAAAVDVYSYHRQQQLDHAENYHQDASHCETASYSQYLDWLVPLSVG